MLGRRVARNMLPVLGLCVTRYAPPIGMRFATYPAMITTLDDYRKSLALAIADCLLAGYDASELLAAYASAVSELSACLGE